MPATAAFASGGRPSGAVAPGEEGQGPINTCFWGKPSANVGPINELNETGANELGPDTNVAYYYTRFQLPAGATITLHGEFPHSRFFSFTSYKTAINGKGEEEPGIASTSLIDEQIVPDAGSIDPYLPGESRVSHHRSFTVTVSGQTPPAVPAPNTLYVGQEGKTGETQQVELMERIYRPDRTVEANGGVPLPAPTLNPYAASPISEEAGVCSALETHSGIESIVTTHIGVPAATYKKLRSELPGTTSPEHPAENPIRWERFFNTTYLAAPFYRGTAYEKLIGTLPTNKKEGFYPTAANAYMSGYASRDFGPNTEGHSILVLHAKMPTHPTTYTASGTNNDAGKQVRYWSISNYTSISKASLLEAGSTSLFDEEVPTNAEGYYTIVVSLPEDRPKNARTDCGVAWMNWGTKGDGSGERPDLDALVIRNQLSAPTFEQSIEKVTTPGTEEEVLGAYYPHGTYMTQKEFEGRQCEGANA